MTSPTPLDVAFIQFFSERIRLERCEGRKGTERLILVEGPTGPVSVDPSKILRILLRNDVLSEIEAAGNDYDYEGMRKDAKGKSKAGKMKKKDKRFGYGDDFWDWWHRHAKKMNGGQDIKTKAEADEQYNIYRSLLLEVRRSTLMQAVRGLSFTDQSKARKLLYLFWFAHFSYAA